MKRFYVGAMLAGLASAWGACKGDPTSALRTGAAALSVTPSVVVLDTAGKTPVLVVVRDAQTNPVVGDVTASVVDATIATVDADAARTFIDGATHAFVVTASRKLDGGSTTLNFKSGPLDTTVTVALKPKVLPGTVSSLTPPGGSVLDIGSTSLLKLDSVTAVTFGDDVPGAVSLLSRSRDVLHAIVPFTGPGTVTIEGVTTTYMGPSVGFTVTTTTSVTPTGNFWLGDES